MKIRIIGGGPAGLFYAYLMKRDDPVQDIRLLEDIPFVMKGGVVVKDAR